jgi:hypothetical protein
MNEDDIRRRLSDVTASVNPRSDLAEVELGAGRVRSRRRMATGVAAAMLIAGAGGAGFGLGRSASSDAPGIAAAAPDVPTAPPVDQSDSDESVPATSSPTVPPEFSQAIPPRPVLSRDSGFAAEDSFLDQAYYPPALELVYERVLVTGERVRLQRGDNWGEGGKFPPGAWQPAPFCRATGELRVTIDGPDLVDVTGAAWYTELFDGLQVTPTEAGWADDRQMRILIVQTEVDATQASVTWVDGVGDQGPVVDGFAVLIVEGTGGYDTGYTIEITSPSGVRTASSEDVNDYYSDPEWRESCEEPPPPLPEPGEQPADAAAARAELSARFDLLVNRNIDMTDKPIDLLDDWTGVEEAVVRLDEGPSFEMAQSVVHSIEDLVFTSPTDAWFRYTIDTDFGFFGDQWGTATLIDGMWQFPRALVCQDLGLAGIGCDPYEEQILPPSWYERFSNFEECFVDEEGTEVCEGIDVRLAAARPG